LEVASGSAINRLSSLETASGSAITRLGALETASGSAITRLSSLETASGSAISRLNSLEVTSGSNITRLTNLENKTGSYATTGSNTFVGGQYFSSSFNPTGFTTTASLYTDGGLRVTKDAYISGTLYLNNVTVFGTQSVAYISSSQLNIGTNIISVNTDTPSVRFGGLAVYDSGSTGLTGSILWDSQDNQWIYSNPSGSEYDSAVFLVGPRNSGVLGNEPGISCNFLSKGNGLHHMTSSGIFEDGSRTCFYNSGFISSSGAACFSGTVCANYLYSTTNVVAGDTLFTGNSVRKLSNNQCIFFRNASGDVEMTIGGTGNVGIGYTNPSVQLQVSGTIATGDSANGWGRLSFNTNEVRLQASKDGIDPIGISFWTQASGGGFAERMRIACDGRIGIGTALPNANLSINACKTLATVSGQACISSGVNDNGCIFFGLGDANSAIRVGMYGMQSWNGSFTDYTTKFTLTKGGVGNIDWLSVNNNGVATFACQICTPSLIANTATLSTSTADYAATITNVQDSSQGLLIRATDNDTSLYLLNLQSSPGAACQSWVDRFAVTKGGNVGVGLTNPSCYYSNQLVVSAGSEGGITIANPSTTGAQYLMFADGTSGADRYRGYMSYNHTDNSMTLATDANTRFTITGTGIACFACQVCVANLISSGQICSVGDNKNLDIGGVAVIRGNGSAYTTHYFTTGAANVAKYVQYNASGIAINQIAADAHSYFNSGCNLGIGYSSPSFRLDVCSGDAQTARFARYCAGTGNTNGQIAEFVNLAISGYSSYIYIGSAPGTDWKIGKNVTNCNANYDFTIVDSSNFGRMRITPTGEVCFACQVCASRFISSDDFNIRNTLFSTTGTLSKLTWTNLYPSTYNVADIGVQLDGNYYNGAIIFRTADADNANVLVERMRMESRGATCFRNTVYSPAFCQPSGFTVYSFPIDYGASFTDVSSGNYLSIGGTEPGTINSYCAYAHGGISPRAVAANTEGMSWTCLRFVLRALSPVGDTVTTPTYLQTAGFFYTLGFYGIGSCVNISGIMDGSRGYSTVVLPWIPFSSFTGAGDVTGFGIRNVGPTTTRIGSVWIQYK
jgi:hypothetical protein